MNQFLFTIDDDPTVHASSTPGASGIYCGAEVALHALYESNGPRVTCTDCRAAIAGEWLRLLSEDGQQIQVILTDALGTSILRDLKVHQSDDGRYFVKFTHVRTGGKGDRANYRVERLLNWLIDNQARVFEPDK